MQQEVVVRGAVGMSVVLIMLLSMWIAGLLREIRDDLRETRDDLLRDIRDDLRKTREELQDIGADLRK